jgi:20S proteasome alpha/beta subunit
LKGSYVANRSSDKIEFVSKKIYSLKCGSSADSQIVLKYTKYYLDNHALELDSEPQVKTAAKLLSSILYYNKQSFSSSFILGGYDNIEGFSLF